MLIQIAEIIATISGLICVYLQTKEKIQAWPFGILSVSISIYIFYVSKLYSDVGLHFVYIFLNLYGWWFWAQKRNQNQENVSIRTLSTTQFSLSWLLIFTICLGLGTLMHRYTDASLPYFDAFTTAGSLVAQFLLAKKFLQNWIVWIVVDLVACPLYFYKGLYFISFLFFMYLLLCIKGYLDWKKSYSTSRSSPTNSQCAGS